MVEIRTADGRDIRQDGGPVGLALSGGGLKAALFHVGVLARLAELDLLRRIDVISGTSGGALIAALYYLHLKRALDADGDIGSDRLVHLVARLESELPAAAETDLRARLFENPLANLRHLSAHHASADRLGDLLDRQFFRQALGGDTGRPVEMRTLAIRPRGDADFDPVRDNPKRYCKAPVLILNAADVGNGQAWWFDAERMGAPALRPAARRLCKAPLLAESPYRRLPTAQAGMTLGRAVAASMAMPGLAAPLSLKRLYPDPDRPSEFLDIRLAEGRNADALGTDALVARGCRRLIVSDAAGFEQPQGGAWQALRTRQLEALEAKPTGDLVLVHMLSEIETPEITPAGPIGKGHVARDRSDQETTSYGVERRVQKLIAGVRADLDAPSEIEAMGLMADGYLIAKRAFQRHRLRGLAWTDSPPINADTWRFAAMFDALRMPSKAQVERLAAARQTAFGAGRLLRSQTVGVVTLALSAALTLVALAASWTALRPEGGADRLWIATTVGLIALAAWFAGRRAGRSDADMPWIDKAWAIAAALPRSLVARFRHRASRLHMKAGRLQTVGIKPVEIRKPGRRTTGTAAPQTDVEKKAA